MSTRCTHDGDDEEGEPENGIDYIEDLVRLYTRPSLEPLSVRSNNLISQEKCSFNTLQIY